LKKNWLFLTIIICIFFVFQEADAIEITATPEKALFGPNDWIQIDVKIDDYAGGAVDWNATKPDGSITSGELSNFDASHTLHTIIRNAFDNQFGTWKIDYFYKDANKTITAEVEPLTVTLSIENSFKVPIFGNRALFQAEERSHKKNQYYLLEKARIKHPKIFKNPKNINKIAIVKVQEKKRKLERAFFTVSSHSDYKEKSLYLPGEVVKINVVVSGTLGSNAILEISCFICR